MTTLEIVKQLDPWTVACAVGAMNGSIYGDVGSRGAVSFDIWLRMVNREKVAAINSAYPDRKRA